MNFRRHPILLLIAVIAALATFPLIAWAQQEVLMVGQDSSGNSRIVRTDTSGNLLSNESGSHAACTNTTLNVGTSGTACPPTQRSDRSSILIQLVQSGETLRVTTDGTTAAAATGISVASGLAYTDPLVGTVSPSCRCSAATCQVNIVECP